MLITAGWDVGKPLGPKSESKLKSAHLQNGNFDTAQHTHTAYARFQYRLSIDDLHVVIVFGGGLTSVWVWNRKTFGQSARAAFIEVYNIK